MLYISIGKYNRRKDSKKSRIDYIQMAIAAIVKCLYNFPFCVFVSEYMNKKRLSNFIKPFERMWITFILEIGGDEGNRTPDLLVANET
ncbi:MAG TPA: hypothetical protein ACFYEH_07555, partial [Candidatus Brocadiaceae bacterium]